MVEIKQQEIITLRGKLKMGITSGTSINGDDFYRVPLQVTETTCKGVTMPRGDKSSYTSKQQRQAEHIEEGYEKRGVPKGEANENGMSITGFTLRKNKP